MEGGIGADAGAFGSPEQMRLQLKSISMRQEIEATPGLSHSGRIVGSDDPEAIGWDYFEAHLKEDGFVGFRCMSPMQAKAVRTWGAPRGSLHEWAVMLGAAQELRAAAVPVMQRPLPDGYRDLPAEEMADDKRLAQMQALVVDAGIAPVARASLRGDVFPSVCVGLSGPNGRLAAVASAAIHGNRFSPWRDTAWIGLVAVGTESRGLGLGARVSAAAVIAAMEKLRAARALAFVADNNVPSQAMLRRVGLQRTTLRTIVVGKRFTR